MSATSRELLTELDRLADWFDREGHNEEAAWLHRAADHIEFLETEIQTDTIDAVDYDDRKQIREVFQDAAGGRLTIEGTLAAENDALLAVARWGARQAFELMTDSAADRSKR